MLDLFWWYNPTGFPCWFSSKESACNAGDAAGAMSLTLGSERSLGERNGNPVQNYCLGNPIDRGAWWAIVYRVAKESDMT